MRMSRRWFSTLVGGAIVLSACGSQSAFAADMPSAPVYKAPPPVVVNPWTFDITPYAWLPSLNGSSTTKGHTTDIDATFFGDLIHRKIPKELFGLMTVVRSAQRPLRGHRRLHLSPARRRQGRRALGDVRIAGAGGCRSRRQPDHEDGHLRTRRRLSTRALGWRCAGLRHRDRCLWRRPAVVAAGGCRVSRLSGALSPILPRRTFTVSGDRAVANSGDITWIDPIVGLRLRHQFAPGSELTAERRCRRLRRRQPVLLAGDRRLSMDLRQDQQHHLVRNARISRALCRLQQGFGRHALCLRHAAARSGCRADREVLGAPLE